MRENDPWFLDINLCLNLKFPPPKATNLKLRQSFVFVEMSHRKPDQQSFVNSYANHS